MIMHDIQKIPTDAAKIVDSQIEDIKPEQQPVSKKDVQGCMAVVPVNVQSRQLDTAAPLIIMRNLRKTYSHSNIVKTVLDGFSLQIQRGEFVAITGPSGTGKSTLLHILGCLIRPSAGDYWLGGNMVSLIATDELAIIRNQRIGFLFQEPALLPEMSVLKNVALPLTYAGFAGAEQKRRAHKALQFVGLGARRLQMPDQLSMGQQQRVAVARALVNSPSLLLADEPTGNLDVRNAGEIIAVLQALNRRGLTIVMATDNVELAAYAKRHIILRAGRIVADQSVASPRIAVEELNTSSVSTTNEGESSTGTRVREEKS